MNYQWIFMWKKKKIIFNSSLVRNLNFCKKDNYSILKMTLEKKLKFRMIYKSW
jgi:hypothetical protein